MAAGTFVEPNAVRTVDGPPGAADALRRYLDLLEKWNRTYNLTAIRERSRMVTHHIEDALAVLPFLPARTRLRMLDVGTGAGIPGLPLAIVRPEWNFTLLDASHKKIAFVTQAVLELRLANVTAIASRVEDLVAEAPFDVVIARAFSDLCTFAQLALPHLASGGVLAAMKGMLAQDEIEALPPSIEVVATPALHVPGLGAERHLVLMRPRTRRER